MKENKKAKNADILFGTISIVTAVLVSVTFFLYAIVGKLFSLVFERSEKFSAGPVIFFGLVMGGLWIFIGVKALLRAELSKKYVKIFGNYPRVKFADAAKQAGKSLKKVSSELKVMKKCGYFPGMSFDLENKDLVFSPDSAPLPKLGGDNTVYKENVALPALALLSSLVSAVSTMSLAVGSFAWAVVSLIIGAGVFFLLRWMFPAPVYFTEEKMKTPVLKKPSSTKNAELDEALNSIYENKKELLRLKTAIPSPKIREPLEEILRVLDEISAYVAENPAKVKQLRQFVNYYMPTTVKFLRTYDELDDKPDKGVNIITTMRKIEEVTGKLTDVYKREYDELFSDRAMDVGADISVMQAIIDENK